MDATRDDDVIPTLDTLGRVVNTVLFMHLPGWIEYAETCRDDSLDAKTDAARASLQQSADETTALVQATRWLASHLPELIARKSNRDELIRGADRMARAIDGFIAVGILGSRSAPADAMYDYVTSRFGDKDPLLALRAAHLSGERNG